MYTYIGNINLYIYKYLYMYIYMYIYININVCTCGFEHVCLYVYIQNVFMYINININKNIYIYICRHTLTRTSTVEDFTRICARSARNDSCNIMKGPLRGFRQDLHKISSPRSPHRRRSYNRSASTCRL